MKRLSLIRAVPVEELSTYTLWPCEEVLSISCRYVMGRGAAYIEMEDRLNPRRVPVKGRHNLGVPFEYLVQTPKDYFFIYRHWDWYWEMSWFLDHERGKDFIPPKLKHEWVMELVAGAKSRNMYVPHADEKPMPSWRNHVLTDPDTPFYGEFINGVRWGRMTQYQRDMYNYWNQTWKGRKHL